MERKIKGGMNHLLWPLVGMLTPGHEKFTCQDRVWQLFIDGRNLTLANSFDIRFSRTSIKLKKSVLTVFPAILNRQDSLGFQCFTCQIIVTVTPFLKMSRYLELVVIDSV